MAAEQPLWQLLSVGGGLGLLWISAHCAGMCGPLLVGLGVGRPQDGAGRLMALASVAAYQGGRASAYAAFGAAAGWVGQAVAFRLRDGELVLAGILAGVFLLAAIARLAPVRRWFSGVATESAAQSLASRLARPLAVGLERQPLLRAATLGLALAFLPCGIVFWALGLAAGTGDPLMGAVVMVALVALTTPALVGVALAPLLLPRPAVGSWRTRAGAWLPSAALAFSGVWILGVAWWRAAEGCCHGG